MAANAIGLLLGALTMIPFLESLMPDMADQTTTLRIGVGLSLSSDANTEGNIPGIRLQDIAGRDLGEARGSKSTIADGGYHDIKVVEPDDAAGRQAEYISISKGGNDALCVAYISITWPDGGKRAWYGDVGKQCNGAWYNSQTIAGDDDYRPACTWIDGDSSNGITTQGMGIHITDFTATSERVQQYADDNDLLCNSKPRFHLYTDLTSDYMLPVFSPPLEYEEGTMVDVDRSKVLVDGVVTSGQGPPSRHRRHRRQSTTQAGNATRTTNCNIMPNRLITSTYGGHSAKELCQSRSSVGPDFVSHAESLFCDMTEKELWPLCNAGGNITSACFDVAKESMMPGQGLHGRDERSGRPVPVKAYTKTSHWT